MCYDCRILPVEETMTAHYTACKKPWECRIPKPRIPRKKDETERLRELTNITTCGSLFKEYFQLRQDVERRIEAATQVQANTTRYGRYNPKYFLGYCDGPGSYLSFDFPDSIDMKSVYGF